MKRLLPLLLALVIAISAAVPAYATGDGNFDGGGGSMGEIFKVVQMYIQFPMLKDKPTRCILKIPCET